MAGNTSPRKLRIAIVGVGFAGATVANALIDQADLDVCIYESAPGLFKRAAAVSLAISAQRALREGIRAADELLVNAGAVSVDSTRAIIVCALARSEGHVTILMEIEGVRSRS